MEIATIIGILAPMILLGSFMLSDIRKLRWLNNIGCLLFIVWGFLLHEIAWPVIATNFGIIIINFYHLFIASKK